MHFSNNRFRWALSSFCLFSGAVAIAACSAGTDDSGPGGATGGTAGGTSATGGTGPGTGGTSGGTGGTTGTGGDGTGTGGATGGSGAVGMGCSAADIFCEDFESVAEGQLPDGWSERESYCEMQGMLMGVATDQPRGSSTKALKITNSSPGNCRIAREIGTVDDFWVRAYVYWGSSVDFSTKEVLAIDLIPSSALGKDDPAIRFGSRTKEPCTATPGSQVTLIGFGEEVTGCGGANPLPQGKWYCIEAHVQQSGDLSVETFIDGADLTYSSKGKPDVDVVSLGAAPSEKVNHVRLGVFSTPETVMGDVWVDDIAVSTTRIGCD